jgi:hypothetical protein
MIRRFVRPSYRLYVAAHEYAHTLVETHDNPAWLDNWCGMDIKSAEYDAQKRQVIIVVTDNKNGWIEIGGAEPKSVEIDQKPDNKSWSYKNGKLYITNLPGTRLVVSY